MRGLGGTWIGGVNAFCIYVHLNYCIIIIVAHNYENIGERCRCFLLFIIFIHIIVVGLYFTLLCVVAMQDDNPCCYCKCFSASVADVDDVVWVLLLLLLLLSTAVAELCFTLLC